jgi:hypothetical protein
MKSTVKAVWKFALLAAVIMPASVANAEGDDANLRIGKGYVDFRLRYEGVTQDNARKDANALTLRTLIGYQTKTYSGWSGTLELEDVRIVGGVDEYSIPPPVNFNPGIYSIVPDPETTEVDQAFVKYTHDKIWGKLGRQVITHDNWRFVGDVRWRQDRQTFDALRFFYTPSKSISLDYSYVTKRNRVLAEAADQKSKDHLLKGDWKTSLGTLGAYAYLLERDNNTNNSLDTVGLRFKGEAELNAVKLLYTLEYASQDNTLETVKDSADYAFVEGGVGFKGITGKLGYEVLGSDNGNYGFLTPLATLHAFNGWADQFVLTPDEGLQDLYIAVGGKLVGGKWLIVYHDFSADKSSPTVNDLGSEVDLRYVYPFKKRYKVGIKYAAYSAGDAGAGKVNTDKLWVWMTASF